MGQCGPGGDGADRVDKTSQLLASDMEATWLRLASPGRPPGPRPRVRQREVGRAAATFRPARAREAPAFRSAPPAAPEQLICVSRTAAPAPAGSARPGAPRGAWRGWGPEAHGGSAQVAATSPSAGHHEGRLGAGPPGLEEQAGGPPGRWLAAARSESWQLWR